MRHGSHFSRLLLPLFSSLGILSATHYASVVCAEVVVTPLRTVITLPATEIKLPDAEPAKPVNPGETNTSAAKLADKPLDKRAFVALILPLASRLLAQVADALRAGFVAAADVTGGEKIIPRIYIAEDEAVSLAMLYRKAKSEGAIAIVAGLTREGAAVVARESGYLPTLALNTPSEISNIEANNFFHISLTLDNDARLAARAAMQDGHRNVTLITSQAALSKRIQEAFEKEWLKLGGSVVAKIGVNGDVSDGGKIRAEMAKRNTVKADVVFIAADMRVARAVRPFLPQGLPVYATSQSFLPYAGVVDNLDLDSVRYLEMPWFAERDHAAVMAYPRPATATSVDYERLYALGIDAWRVMLALLPLEQITAAGSTQKNPEGEARDRNNSNISDIVSGITNRNSAAKFNPIDGVTGRISLEGNQLNRSLTLLEMRDGKPQLVKSAE